MFETHSIDMDRRTGVALWRQIADRLRASLSSDIVGDNGKLPSEKDLAHHFGVNRHTVRAAIAALSQEGLLRSRQGQGTFVINEFNQTQNQNAKSMLMGNPLDLVKGSTIELVATAREAASAEIAEKLFVAEGGRVVRLDTVSYQDKRLLSRSTCWFDALRFADLGKLIRKHKCRIEALKDCGVKAFQRGETSVHARLANNDDMSELDLGPGTIVLVTKVQNLEQGGSPFHYSVSRIAMDRSEVRLDG
ncbi:MAG: phosphonate metabolism transcriptional regulator PhnF [Hyphomicrobiales bacterium]